MSDLSKLLKNGLLDEETVNVISEAFEAKLAERMEEKRDELREEFASKYEHDKEIMIESANKMINDSLVEEIESLRNERDSLIEEKIRQKKIFNEQVQRATDFIAESLTNEITELRQDRANMNEALAKFEKFAVKILSEEIAEFHQEKRDLSETRVRLINEAKDQISKTRKEIIERSAVMIEGFVEDSLREEFTTLREDIKQAKKNLTGMKIYEAFAAEVMENHISDGTKIKSLFNELNETKSLLEKATATINEQENLIASAEKKSKLAESRLQRHKVMNELLSPLSKRQKEIMSTVLDKVPTKRLRESYDKNIGYVLNEDTSSVKSKRTLNEGTSHLRDVSGHKRTLTENKASDNFEDAELARLRKNAGINIK